MNTIEISETEREVLGGLLKSALANLEIEIRRTDHLEFKEALKQRREILNELAGKLQHLPIFSQ